MRKPLIFSIVALAAFAFVAQPASATVTPVVRSALGAGYVSGNNGSISLAKTRFTVPSITCAQNDDFEVLYLGVFGLDGTNAQTSWAGLFAGCNNGSKTYYAAAFTPTQGLQQLSVTIGDVLVASLGESNTQSTATVVNQTSGHNAHSTSAHARDVAVLVGDFGSTHVPTFTTIHFSNTKVNGVVLGSATPLTKEVLKTGSDVQITPNVITASASGLTIEWHHNT